MPAAFCSRRQKERMISAPLAFAFKVRDDRQCFLGFQTTALSEGFIASLDPFRRTLLSYRNRVKGLVHSLNQRQFDSAILRATIGCFVSSNEMRCSECTSNQAI